MEFGDKITDLPTDENAQETPEKQMLINILKPKEPSKFSSLSYNIKLVLIAVILYFCLKTDFAKSFLSKYIENPNNLDNLISIL